MATVVCGRANDEGAQDQTGSVFPMADPLHASAPLPFHHVLFPYGFPVHVRANHNGVLRAAETCWGSYRRVYPAPPLELRFFVSEASPSRIPPPPVFRAQANLLTLVADANHYGCCDLAAGFGFAQVTATAVNHPDYLRYHFLESMAYSLLDTRHLVAIHAACIGRRGHGILLAGESGAGKSSLAYACARRGWTYIADDASSVVLRKQGRTVVGNPRAFRFRPEVTALFPELKGAVHARNGKPTIEVETRRLPHVKVAYEYTVDHIVFLNRYTGDEGLPRLTPISARACLKRLFQNPWPSELAINQERDAAIERLLTAPAYELRYQEFDAAIDLLDTLAPVGEL
jgi:hypothetical protein